MPLEVGSRIGAYEITSHLGEGGMGVVFRARDTKLSRDVAIKAIPDAFAKDADRLARFQREAQVLATLNHPNIAHIYGFEEVAGSPCIVMELVEGETLAQRLRRGPIPIEDAVKIARQIAEGLEAAHAKDIIHRDLKPGNVMVMPDNRVKVLDFGLAKAFAGDSREMAASNSPTLTMAATQQGIVLGTAAYMSPEQARGRSVDKRSDVFAFGCVLYEMLTGKPAFDGSDVSEILATVIKMDPAWQSLPPAFSPVLEVFLRRCLEKDPQRRIHDIGDVRLALEGAFDSLTVPSAEPIVASSQPSWRRLVLVSLCTLLITSLAAAAIFWIAFRPGPRETVRLTALVPIPVGVTSGGAPEQDLAISPDGRSIAYIAGENTDTSQLYVRKLDQLEPTQFKGNNGARSPFFSPDGNWIGFFQGGSLKKVSINGGPAVTICNIVGGPRGASWGKGDVIVFATSDSQTGLWRVAGSGGTPEVLTKPDVNKGEADHILPEMLPDGQTVLFTLLPRDRPVENAQIISLDFKTGSRKVLVQGGSNPHYSTSGHIVYGVNGTLRAVPFDLAHLQTRGNPTPVLEQVWMKPTGAADFSIAGNGSLVYVSGNILANAERTLVWVDRQGHEEPVPVPVRAYAYVRISPDGTRAALDIRDQENDIWVWDFVRRTLTRLTFEPGFNRGIAWTADGRRLAFSSQRDGRENVYWQSADGTGTAERLEESTEIAYPTAFTPDGTQLLFNTPDASPYDIGVINTKDHKRELLFKTPANELNASISPDGRWIAYESNESGRSEVYVRPFPNVDSGRWQISVGGGSRPLWSRDGKEIFYFVVPGKVVAVPVQVGTTFNAGNPQTLFEGRYLSVNSGLVYDVSPDGRRFLMIKESHSADAKATTPQLVVVLNWLDELKRMVPAN